MSIITRRELFSQAVNRIKTAAIFDTFNLRKVTPYLFDCSWYIEEYECALIYIREVGYRAAGKWPHANYERCYSLKLTFPRDVPPKKVTDKMVKEFFGDNMKYLWVEKDLNLKENRQIWTFRLFCDENWKPITDHEDFPLHFIAREWKIFNDIKGEIVDIKEAV